MVIPYAASTEWYSEWLRARLGGLYDPEACREASRIYQTDTRPFRRTVIPADNGPMTLSVSVAKGPGHFISSHGRWPKVHLGALNAIYGRAPFFQHIFPYLSQALLDTPETIPELNAAIHRIITGWIDMDAARLAISLPPEAPAHALASELKKITDPSLSILDPIFRFGIDTTLLLI